ncbi:autotransporter outer membrane beta-barrel domain-containing protein [Rahnella sp. CFA14(1/10)]|uniref:autotransporter family protein n=1 Tax=Rahnella sp. CFA14(1/10) TaxID=2511203 RepID=UPI0010202AB3|nr:autotransporter outer membrane beta-barrel domain-containing protein [Rahnella sp. CFA14(1/10)]
MDEYMNGSRSFKRTLLSSAIFSLLLPSSVAFATTTYSTGITPADALSFATTGAEDHAYTITGAGTEVIVDGEITAPGIPTPIPVQSVVSTTGSEAYAFNIIDESKLILNYADVSTTDSSKTFNITTGASAEINNADISSGKDDSSVIYASDKGSILTGDNIRLTSDAAQARGIDIQSGASASLSNINIELTNAKHALTVSDSSLVIENLTVEQTSAGSQNVIYASGSSDDIRATVDIINGNVRMTGNDDIMVNTNTYSDVTLTGGTYATTGSNNTGFFAASQSAKLTANDLSLTTNGMHSYAVDARGEAELNNVSITTLGDKSYALYVAANEATNAGLSPAILTAKNVVINTEGSSSAAAVADHAGIMNLDTAEITTTGAQSNQLVAMKDSTLDANKVKGISTGNSASAVRSYANSQITISNSVLSATGALANGIYTQGFDADHQAIVTLDNSLVSSATREGILAEGANTQINVNNNSTVQSGNGVLLRARSFIDTNTGVTAQSQVNLSASNSHLEGEIIADTGSVVDVYLNSGSNWQGTTASANNVNIDASSIWTVTGDSEISQMNSHGTTSFTHNGDDYSELTVNGDMTGDGVYRINTYLDDSNSLTDQIHVTGDITGKNILYVTNTGGGGNNTPDNGIEVITVHGTNTQGTDAFALGNSVSAGAFNYGLRKGDINTGEGENWYLSNCASYDCSTPIPDPDPIPDPTPDDNTNDNPDVAPTPTPSDDILPWREEVPGYIAAPVLNMQYGFDVIGTYHQRTGGDVLHKDGAWGRIVGTHTENDAGRYSYDTDTSYAQLGMDLMWDKDQENTERSAGILVTLGRQNTDAEDSLRSNNSMLSVQTGSLDSDIYSLGGYYTLKAQDGGYIDTVGMGSWYKNSYDSTHDADQDGYGIALSIEAGKPFVLHENLKIEPQAQVIYQYLNLEDFSDGVSNVSGVSTSNAQARGGVRLLLDNPTWTPYLTLDVVTTIGDEPDVQIADKRLKAEFSDSWWQTGAGVAGKLNENTTIYTDVRYQKGFDSDLKGYSGNLGIKVNF